jgi:hypothetical protein
MTRNQRHDLKSELERSATLVKTLRDEILVQVHLGTLEARAEWKRVEPLIAQALERAATEVSDKSREALTEAMQAAKRFRDGHR